ncbi:hypothetical protein KIPB_014528, partial [Kipferlia bialata]
KAKCIACAACGQCIVKYTDKGRSDVPLLYGVPVHRLLTFKKVQRKGVTHDCCTHA